MKGRYRCFRGSSIGSFVTKRGTAGSFNTAPLLELTRRVAGARTPHSLPRLLSHGRWPVGEEWCYQAWAQSYLPVLGLLEDLAKQGLTERLTLGVTPVLAEQLNHPVARDGLGA